jgi:hypothetical protein
LEDAKKAFHKKFKDKTGQDFGLVFVHKGGKFYNCSVQALWGNSRAAAATLLRRMRCAAPHTRAPVALSGSFSVVRRRSHRAPARRADACRAQHEREHAYMAV